MRRHLTLAALVPLLVSCERPAPVALPAPTPPRLGAVLVGLSGNVQVKRSEASDWSVAAERMELGVADKVRTMKGAAAQLLFPGGSTVVLDEESLVSVSRAGPTTSVQLLEGRVDAELVAGTDELAVEAAGGEIRPARRELTFQ